MTRDRIISDLWQCPKLNTAIGKMKPAELQDDLRQELFLELLRLPEEKLTTLHEAGQLSRYAFGIIRNMILTNRGAFYNTHRRFSREMYAIETDPADTSDQTAPLIEHIDATIDASFIARLPARLLADGTDAEIRAQGLSLDQTSAGTPCE